MPVTWRPADVLPLRAHDYFELAQPGKVPSLISQVLRLPLARQRTALDFVAVLVHNCHDHAAAEVVEAVRPAKPRGGFVRVVGGVRGSGGGHTGRRPVPAGAELMQRKTVAV